MRTIKRLLLVVLLLAVLLASAIGYYVVRPLTFPILPLEFSLSQGSSLKTAARQMQQAGALPNDWMFVWLARMLGKSAQIQAGNYELETAVTMLELLAIVTEGQAAQSKFSIIEGWTFNQFRAALNTNPAIRHDSVSLSETEIMRGIGATEAYAEGQFFLIPIILSKTQAILPCLSAPIRLCKCTCRKVGKSVRLTCLLCRPMKR